MKEKGRICNIHWCTLFVCLYNSKVNSFIYFIYIIQIIFSCALLDVDVASVQGLRVSGRWSRVNYVSCYNPHTRLKSILNTKCKTFVVVMWHNYSKMLKMLYIYILFAYVCILLLHVKVEHLICCSYIRRL